MLAVLILLITVLSVHSIRITNAEKYTKENVTFFEDTYSYGIWDIRFDEDLYTYQAFGSNDCFLNSTCRPSNIQCEPCDWTDPLICSGEIRGPNSTCPCVGSLPSIPLMCYPNLYPLDSYIWLNISEPVTLNITHGTLDAMFHPKPPNNCSCIIFRYDLVEGEIQGVLLYFGETWVGTNSGIYVLSRHGTATVCPSNPRWGQSHVARLVGDTIRSPIAVIRLSVEYMDVSSTIHDPACSVPVEYSSTHRCVPTNVFTTLPAIPGQGYMRVVIDPVVRCGVIGFWINSNEHLLSTDPWVSLQNSSNTFRTHRNGVVDGRLYPSIYPYCLQPSERLYVYIITSTPVDFFIDTAKEWMVHRPLTDFPPADYYKRLLGAVTAICPTGNYTAHRAIYPVSENMETGSISLRAIYPSDDVDVMYPAPLTANEQYRYSYNVPVLSSDSNRLIVSLLLNQHLASRLQPVVWRQPWFDIHYQWMTVGQWSECQLRISEMITDSNGIGINLTVSVDMLGSDQFDSSTYSKLSSKIDALQDDVSEGISEKTLQLNNMYSLWLQQSRISSSDTMYRAKQYVTSYAQYKQISKEVVTDKCVSGFDNTTDPCCHLNDTSFYQQCSVGIRSVGNQYEISSYTDNIAVCPIEECAQLSLTNLRIEDNLIYDPTACTSSVDRPVDQNVYWRCIESIWGPDPVSFAGPKCTHDIDCPNSTCNVYSKRCFVDISAAETMFISCLYDGISQFARTFVSNELGINSTSNIKASWQNIFSELLPCSDPYTPVGFQINLAVYSLCYGCGKTLNTTMSYWAPSPGTSWANFGRDCWAPLSSSCTITPTIYAAKTYCAALGCTSIPYDKHPFLPYTLAPAACSNATYCGVSDDGFFYTDVTSVIPLTSCNNSILCILANGTQISVSTTNECEALMSCDALCNGGECMDQSQCNNSGVCSDSTDYDIGIWKGLYVNDNAGCFFTIHYKKPFNPTVKVCEPPFRDTIIGCSVVPSVMSINRTSCESGDFVYGDPSIFDLVNPRWIVKATTEDECLSYGTVCDNPLNPQSAGINSYTNTLSFSDSCSGITRNLFTWRPGRWLKGQVRYTNVTTGRLAPRFSSAPRFGLNLPLILSNLTKATDNLQLLKAQSSSFCRGGYRRYLDELVCSCNAKQNDTVCYSSKSNITGIGVVCDEIGEFSVGDYRIKTVKESLPPATCDNLYISVSSITLYRSRVITPLRTLLVNYQEDTEFAIRNERLGIYGKVLSTGYAAQFSVPISNVTLCIKLSTLRYGYELDKYPVLDFGKRPADSRPDDILPLEVPVQIYDDMFCTNLSMLEDNVLYYVIQRVSGDYALVNRTVFSSGEIAYIAVLLALYSFGLIISTIRFFFLIAMILTGGHRSTYQATRLLCIFFLIMSFFVFRVVLFCLLLNNSLLGSSSTRAVSYLLFEFPILILFAFVTNYIFLWVVMAKYAKRIDDGFQKRIICANNFSIILNLIIFGLFILMLILFETIIFEPYLVCGGAVILYDSEQNHALILSYRIIFSSIAIIIGLAIIMVAPRAGYYLGKKKFGFPRDFRMRLYAASIAGGFGFIGQAIYFLVITILDITPNNYASLTILLCLELIPALIFSCIDKVPKPKLISSGGSGKKTHSGGSNDPSSGGTIVNSK